MAARVVSLRHAPLRRRCDDPRRHARARGVEQGQGVVPGRGRLPRVPHRRHAARVHLQRILDPVEASIARRRSYATILSHLCPPLRAVEGSEDLRNCCTGSCTTTTTRSRTRSRSATTSPPKIAEIVERTGLRIDAPGMAAKAFVAKVHDELVALEGDFAPMGQHVYGRDLTEQDRLDTLHACLEYADIDLYRLLADCYAFDYDALIRKPDARDGATARTITRSSSSCARPAARCSRRGAALARHGRREVQAPRCGDARHPQVAADRGQHAREEPVRARHARGVRRPRARAVLPARPRRRGRARGPAHDARGQVPRAVDGRRARRRLDRAADGPQHVLDRRAHAAARSRAAQGQAHGRADPDQAATRRARRVSRRPSASCSGAARCSRARASASRRRSTSWARASSRTASPAPSARS